MKNIGNAAGTTYGRSNIRWPVEMATAPTATIYDNATNANAIYTEGVGPMAIASVGATTTGCQQYNYSASQAGAAAGQSILGQWKADTGW